MRREFGEATFGGFQHFLAGAKVIAIGDGPNRGAVRGGTEQQSDGALTRLQAAAQETSGLQGVDFVRIKLLGGEDDHVVAVAIGEPTLRGAEGGGPAGFVPDLRIDRPPEAERGDHMAERAVENRFGKEDRTGKAASFLGDLAVEANAVDEATEEKRGNDPGATAVKVRGALKGLLDGLDHEVGDRAGAAEAGFLLPAEE